MKHRHRIELSAARDVRIPSFGPEAYTSSWLRETFPFGKGNEYTNSASALAAARTRMSELTPLASKVELVTFNGGHGRRAGGIESDRKYATDWHNVELDDARQRQRQQEARTSSQGGRVIAA